MIGILLVPIGLALLLFFAAYEKKFGLSLDHTVRISDSLTVICTTILALALQYFFARRNTDERDQRELVSSCIKDLLTSLQDLRGWVSDAITGADPTAEQAQKIVYGFECCIDALLMLELACEASNSSSLEEQAGDLAGLILDCKKLITGDDFPKRITTYADVEVLSGLRREFARKLVPLYRRRSTQSLISNFWHRFRDAVDRESADMWK
jgi:hypothetical protein